MNRWKIATVACALVAATGWTITPASSHVASWAHNWSEHIKPRADKRYATKVVDPGRTVSGTWATSAPSGNYGMVTVDFNGRMAGPVTPVYAATTSTSCPGAGWIGPQASPGVPPPCGWASATGAVMSIGGGPKRA